MSTVLTDEIKYLIEVEKGYSPIYEHLSVELYATIWDCWKRNVVEARSEMVKDDLRDPKAIAELFKNKLSNEFALEAEESVIKIIRETFKATKKAFLRRFKKGIEKAEKFLSSSLREIDYEAIEYLRTHTNWWMKNYYDRYPGEKMSELLRQGLEKELSTKELGEVLQSYFYGEVLEDGEWPKVPGNMTPKEYFEGLSRNTISRARMNATVNGFIETQIEAYEIIATEDGRTCDICRSMHGRVFETATAKRFVDQFNSLETPEDVKSQLPWVKNVSETSKATGDLPLSFSLPPFHYNCRCNVLDRDYTIEEESQRMLDDESYAKEFADNMLLATDSGKVNWNVGSIEAARMMVKIARKEKVYDREFKSFIKKSSWKNEALLDHFKKHKKAFKSAGIELSDVDDYQQFAEDILFKGEVWGIISADRGFPQLISVLRHNNKLFTAVVNVKGQQIATVFPSSRFYDDLVKDKEFYYLLKKAKVLKILKRRKGSEKMTIREMIEVYKINVVCDMDKNNWDNWTEPDGRIFPPEDAVTVTYYRDDVYNNFSSCSDADKMMLKEIDEILLNDLDTACEMFRYSHLDKKQPKEKWWYHLPEIRDGKLKVFWDEEKKVYSTEKK